MSRRVHEYILRNLRRSSLHFTLIDPEKQSADRAGQLARSAEEAGSHAIMVGGSTVESREATDATVRAIKASVEVPVILFPGGGSGVSGHADAIFFMSMLNSQSPQYLVGEQVRAVEEIEAMGLEAIPVGYLVVEPGGKVGEVGHAKLLPRDRPEEAVKYALVTKYFGMRFVYLDAGSGAATPVPLPMIHQVKKRVDLPVIVGGGIRDASTARGLVEAGADIIVTGNIVEGPVDVQKTLGVIIKESIHELAKKIREAV